MNADVRPIKTAAEQGLAEAFFTVKGKLPGDPAIAALREQAFERFEAQGLPHRRVEQWKYTDLRALMREAKPLAGPPNAGAKTRGKNAGAILSGVERRRIVFVDGVLVPELSDLKNLEKGISIRPLADILATSAAEAPGQLAQLAMSGDPAIALNTAFMSDGAVIHVDAGVRVIHPLHLAFIATSEKAAAIFARSVVVVGSRAQLALIESFEGPNGVDYQVNHALELAVGEEAQVDHLRVLTDGDKALHLSSLLAAIGGKAKYNDVSFVAGGAVVRNQLSLRFEGEGAQADIRGATLLKARQHADTTLVIDHVAGHCLSRETFKSVLDGESRGVFQGKIIVRPHAQKTDGKMMTNALLLSETAEADSKPELEIFADDVVCGHGSTAGALDQELLFYLKARGIPAKEAEALLIEGFVGEAIDGIANEGAREALMGAARNWLAARG